MKMARYKFVSPLSDQQVAILKNLSDSDHGTRTRKRADAILLSNRGYTIDEISAIMEKHRFTVGRWIAQWEERGVDGLLEREGRGRPNSLDEEEQKRVLEWLAEEPRSSKILCSKVEEVLGKSVCEETLRRIFRRNGRVWKRARTSLSEKRDEEEFRLCGQELIEHMEAAVNGEIDLLYLDESGFGRVPDIPYVWQNEGEATKPPCRDGKRINVLGLYSLMEGTLQTKMLDRNMKSADVVGFLDEFSEGLKKFTVVTLDNATIHTAKVVSEKLEEWESRNLYLYFLPTYSPELNLIEIVWRKIKYEWLPLRAYESFKQLWSDLSRITQGIGSEYNINFV